MGLEFIAQGTGLANLPSDESYPEGTRLQLWIWSPVDLSGAVQWGLEVAGVNLTEPVRYEDGWLKVSWLKGFPWLFVIAGVLIALGLAFASWQLYKVVEITGPGFLWIVAIIILIALLKQD